MTRTLYLCGGGNPEGVRLALCVNRAQPRWDEVFLLDDDPSKHGHSVLGVRVAGGFDVLGQANPKTSHVVNLVARTTDKRRAARGRIAAYGLPFASLVHPSVDVSGVALGDEVTIYENASVCALSSVGQGSVIFMGAIVGHGSVIGQHCVIAPGAVINARTRLGEGTYLGTNASILPDLQVGENASIGSNTAVIQDVPAGASVMGVPGQVLQTKSGGTSTSATVQDSTTPSPKPDANLEQLIASSWRELLERERVGLQDNFFDLGGTSLLALQLYERLRSTLDASLQPTDVFRFLTVGSMAAHIAKQTAGASPRADGRAAARLERAHLRRRSAEHP